MNKGDFLLIWKMVYCMYSLESPLQHTFMLRKIENISYYALLPGAMTNTHFLELPLSRIYFQGSKGVRATEVRQYNTHQLHSIRGIGLSQ